MMDRETVQTAIRHKQLEDSLKGDFLASLEERISRYNELEFIKLTPNAHFASISSECINLYRDGYYFACIALSQSTAEAIARLMCLKTFHSAGDYEKNIELLNTRGIQPDCYDLFKEIWIGRNDYHHLNPNVQTEKAKLQTIAKAKITLLHQIESRVFEFKFVDGGAILPTYPKYWDINEKGQLNVFLRLEN